MKSAGELLVYICIRTFNAARCLRSIHVYRHEPHCLRELLGREVPWKLTYIHERFDARLQR